MYSPIQIWTCAAFHPAYLCGGWASVRVGPGQVMGVAGGDRCTTASRVALTGLAAALRDLPPGDERGVKNPVDIRTTSPELAAFAEVLAHLGSPGPTAPPDDDLDLWAQIFTASAGRPLKLIVIPLEPDTPAAFATAWADLARDKAKASGPFTAAIPKSNLAKVPGLVPR
jgi:hypothetical protein